MEAIKPRWKDRWRSVAVRLDVKKAIIILAAEDDIEQGEVVKRLVEAETARRNRRTEPHANTRTRT